MSIANSAAHHHDHAHHFDSAEHEYNASKEGMWLFLVTEVLMFGGLFVGYAIYHSIYPEVFRAGAQFLDWRLGSLNTVVLISSSLTMALAIYYIQKGKPEKATPQLIITLLCGLIFMVVKYFEYTHKIHDGLLPGSLFNYHGEGNVPDLALYFSFYFLMTGLHGSHVFIGMCLITWVLIRNLRGDFNANKYTAVECVGLFWHLVDLIWIYLFPLLYLTE